LVGRAGSSVTYQTLPLRDPSSIAIYSTCRNGRLCERALTLELRAHGPTFPLTGPSSALSGRAIGPLDPRGCAKLGTPSFTASSGPFLYRERPPGASFIRFSACNWTRRRRRLPELHLALGEVHARAISRKLRAANRSRKGRLRQGPKRVYLLPEPVLIGVRERLLMWVSSNSRLAVMGSSTELVPLTHSPPSRRRV
jgi:hypothetical protein